MRIVTDDLDIPYEPAIIRRNGRKLFVTIDKENTFVFNLPSEKRARQVLEEIRCKYLLSGGKGLYEMPNEFGSGDKDE